MEKKYFSLETKENSKTVKLIQIVFGIICIVLAAIWVFYNLSTLKSNGTVWVTIVFLLGFGAYQILAGYGKTDCYIETVKEKIVLKQNAFLPKIELKPEDLTGVEIYPLSIQFLLKGNKKIIFRFGLSNTDIINPVKDEIAEFAGLNGLSCEEKKEDI
jgi:hypothetical protein